MPREPEPLQKVRKARASAEKSLAELQVKHGGLVGRLRAVHPGILIGASVVAGFVLAKVLTGRRARKAARAVVGSFAPIAALAGYLQSFMWKNAAMAAQRWWTARARHEEVAAAKAESGTGGTA